jgi:hypothetical protein
MYMQVMPTSANIEENGCHNYRATFVKLRPKNKSIEHGRDEKRDEAGRWLHG